MCDLGNLLLEFYHQEFNRRKIYVQIGHYNIIQNSETFIVNNLDSHKKGEVMK